MPPSLITAKRPTARPPGSLRSPSLDRQTARPLESQITERQSTRPSGSPRSPSPDRQTAGSLEPQIAERQTRTSKPDLDCRRPDATGNPSLATLPDLQTATIVGLAVNNHKSPETVLTRLKLS